MLKFNSKKLQKTPPKKLSAIEFNLIEKYIIHKQVKFVAGKIKLRNKKL
jgi:hypothetical protein